MDNASIQQKLNAELVNYYNTDEIRAFLFWILPHLEAQQTHKEEELNRIIVELQTGKPIQYITGIAFFGKLELKVTPSTLIPRPETEELCEMIHRHFKQLSNPNQTDGCPSKPIHGIDLGTGSGCIPIYLLTENPNWNFTGVDISESAIEIANVNARNYHVSDRFTTSVDDVLGTFSLPSNIQLLVSNPPYISAMEKESMLARVLEFEPHSALFTTDQDPLQFYKKIAELVSSSAIQQLSIWLEINQYYPKEIQSLFNPLGETQILKDISGNPRFLHCEMKKVISQ
jgi:release factor glutamine methyltransferase